MQPKISVVTTSYNYEKYIEETIKSVLQQTYTNWEMLIIDDGSTDNSISLIKEYAAKDNRIKLYTHDNNANLGLIESLKKGITLAQGQYVLFLESDDYIANNYMEQKLLIFESHENIGLVYNDIEFIGSEPSKRLVNLRKDINYYWQKNPSGNNFSDYLAIGNYIPTFSCVMLRKHLLNDLKWDFSMPKSIDWYLWIQIAQKTDIYYINTKLTFWRIHKTSYTNSAYPYKKIKKFYDEIYEIIPPIKSWKIKIYFYLKKFGRFIKYCVYKLKRYNSYVL